MNFLTIEKTRIGYYVKDTISNIKLHYVGYTEKNAIKEHRNNMNIRYKHFTKIYI